MPDYIAPEFHRLTPADEVEARIRKLQTSLIKRDIDAALLVYPVDIFYFSGSMQDGHLLVPARQDPLLLIRRDPARAAVESPLTVIELSSLSQLPAQIGLALGGEPKKLAIELDLLPVNLYRKYADLWSDSVFEDVSPLIMALRAVKSEYEIGLMREAGELGRRVYARVPELMRPGRTEIEAAGLLTAEAYRGGHQNYLYMRGFDKWLYTWHVISGPAGGIHSRIDAAFGGYGLSPAFPMGSSRKVIEQGESVLIDFGICLDGYQVDQTRMFSMGKPHDTIRAAYEALLEIEAAMLAETRPGNPAGAVFDAAVRTADRLGFGDQFLGQGERKVRFAGHGVGLEINEPPVIAPGRDAPLLKNMTFALELKMVFPGLGAVGLENTVVVRPEGPEKLTTASEELIEI